MSANDFVPRGASVHSSSGETLSPYPEKRSGMRPCDSNARVRRRMFPIFSFTTRLLRNARVKNHPARTERRVRMKPWVSRGIGEKRKRRAARRMTNTHRATRKGDYLLEQSAEIMRIDSTCSFWALLIDDE